MHKRRSFTKRKFFKVFPTKSKQSSSGLAVLYSLGDHHASSKETKIRPTGCMLCKVSTVLSLSWFYLSFGCIFRMVLGMTIWQNVLFWFSPTHQPETVHGAVRPRALGRGLALVLLRWNFSLFCISWLVLPPPPTIPTYRLISKIGGKVSLLSFVFGTGLGLSKR